MKHFLFFSVERERVQKKTFTKWVNSHLIRINCKVVDLYTDLRDGKYLIKLLEILSGERLVCITRICDYLVVYDYCVEKTDIAFVKDVFDAR